MNKIMIVTDSTNDLSKDILEENNIKVLPLSVNFGLEFLRDGVDITTPELYKRVEETGKLPHSAAITPGEFMVAFEEILNEGYDIVYTGIGSKLSSSYENACMVAKELAPDRIEVVDSENLSTGIGMLVYKACKWRKEGKDIHEIASLMRDMAPRVRSQFVIETMEYLHKGGRCSSLTRLLGTMLKIKPLIAVRNGAMTVHKKPRGKMTTCLDTMFQMILDEGDNVDQDIIFVTHSIAPESCAYLMPKVQAAFPNAKVVETHAGCVISTHCGPGTIGILWVNKK